MAELQLDQTLPAGVDFVCSKNAQHGCALGSAKEYFHLAIVRHTGAGTPEQPEASIDAAGRGIVPRMTEDLTPLKLGGRNTRDVHSGAGTWPDSIDFAAMILKTAYPTTLSRREDLHLVADGELAICQGTCNNGAKSLHAEDPI